MAASSDLACAYAALILHDDDVAITGDKIAALLKAANVEVDGFWPALFAKNVNAGNIGSLISAIGSGGSGPAPSASAAPAAAAGAAKPAAAAKAPEPEPEEEAAMDFDLFG